MHARWKPVANLPRFVEEFDAAGPVALLSVGPGNPCPQADGEGVLTRNTGQPLERSADGSCELIGAGHGCRQSVGGPRVQLVVAGLVGELLAVDGVCLGGEGRAEVVGEVGKDVGQVGAVDVQFAGFGEGVFAVDE